ncbi:MAG TPA: Holliday junction resolvase RuvX [Candidatus Saccharimonadales bacterium]|nr:Holliday junction resolvase RuvX [Candidatus Saccharimonadales bacterium]
MEQRIVGIDLGTERIGIAVATGEHDRARPLATLRRAPSVAADVAAIVALLGGKMPGEVVLGLPFEASGVEGPQARLTRSWAVEAVALLGLPIQFRDERLSSHLAEERMGPMKRGRSGGPPTPSQRRAYRARVDREAAAIILQDDLDARVHDAP